MFMTGTKYDKTTLNVQSHYHLDLNSLITMSQSGVTVMYTHNPTLRGYNWMHFAIGHIVWLP